MRPDHAEGACFLSMFGMQLKGNEIFFPKKEGSAEPERCAILAHACEPCFKSHP